MDEGVRERRKKKFNIIWCKISQQKLLKRKKEHKQHKNLL